MPASVALARGGGHDALLDVVVDHRPGDDLLAGLVERGQLGGDDREHLVEVQLDARHLVYARDVERLHGLHKLRMGLLVVKRLL